MFNPKKRGMVLLLAALVVFFLALPAWAMETRSGELVMVPEGSLQGPLFVAGNNVVINADVDGDVFAAGETVTINGRINGDLLAAARSIRINGSVSGDARCAAEEVDLKGEVQQSFTAAAREVRLMEESRVGRDLLTFVNETTLAGAVGRQVMGSGELFRLNGPVGGDVRLWEVGELKVGPTASIEGNLTYGSKRQAEVASGARIQGTTKWEQIQPAEKPVRREGVNWLAQLATFAAGVLTWGVFALLFPRLWSNLSQNAQEAPWPALGWGLLLLLVTPLAALLLMVTVIGIPLSLTLLGIYTLLLYAGKIILGDTVGRLLSRRFGWKKRVHDIFPFMLGFAGLVLLSKIPVVGFFVSVVVACLAIGVVFLSFYRWRQRALTPTGIE